MTASKFKVGDRVVHYSAVGSSRGNIVKLVGNLIEIKFEGMTGTTCVHSKACRRLIKKPRRRVWAVIAHQTGNIIGFTTSKEQSLIHPDIVEGDKVIEFIEVKKRGGE